MTPDEFGMAVRAFPRWHYEFDICGVKTPIFDPDVANRHRQREPYLLDPLVEVCGGSLRGKRVLDLGCNAGYWSLKVIERGCPFVYGVDGRQMHIDQAELVFRAAGVTPGRYHFARANVFDFLACCQEKFDIVLCLGLFYHVNKHVNLLEGIRRVNEDILLIDTTLSRQPGAVLEILHEPLDEPRNACDYDLVMHPSRRAVCELVRLFGYQCRILEPAFTDYTGAEDFRDGTRRAFLCSRRGSLAALSFPTDSEDGPVDASLPVTPERPRRGIRRWLWPTR